MKKPSGIVEQVWDFRVLRHKAYEAHKAYDKARDEYEKAMQKCRDVPILDEDEELDSDKAYKYKIMQETMRTMNAAHSVMAEAYCDYVNHNRKMRERK